MLLKELAFCLRIGSNNKPVMKNEEKL